ncbi:MAG: UDP-N-acetylmuramate dehydrogenase [Ignavibacteriales bacterium]|nr:UDP-N-acetylmuramate dehydrogenase [Ignavibacteriales bacterium]
MIIEENISLKNLNTFGIDCVAKRMITFSSEAEIQNYLLENNIEENKTLILGGGSNILFTNNYDGTILKSAIIGIKEIKKDEDYVYLEVGSGVVWDELVNFAVNNNYGGIENLSLIPGTVGAAPIQNIGAYGVEFEEVFESLEGVDLLNNTKLKFNKSQCKFGYRDSIFKREFRNKLFITKVILKLNINPILKTNYRALQEELKKLKAKKIDIKLISKIVSDIRESKLPNPKNIGNAGSFFKNPIVNKKDFTKLKLKYIDLVFFEIDKNTFKIPAGWLIEKSGFKGKKFGDVGVHTKQALVLVNYGNGSGTELIKLAKQIQSKIKRDFNILLETEVNII